MSSVIDIEFISDSILIDRYISQRSPLNKVAGAKEIFSEIGSRIIEEVKGLIDPNDPLKSILNIGAAGLLTIFTPWWAGLIVFIAQEFFGFQFTDLLDKAKSLLVSTLEQNKKVTKGDIKGIVNQVMGGGDSADDGALNGEEVFRRMAIAEKWYRKALIQQMPLVRTAGAEVVLKPFAWVIKKVVSRSTAKSFIGKILSYVLKCILIALGMKGVGKAIKSIAPGAADAAKNFFTGIGHGNSSSGGSGLAKPHNLKPSGFGEEREPERWEEGFPKTNIASMLANWAVQRYPQLSSVQSEMMQTPAFKTVLQAIENENRDNHYSNKTYIPHVINGHRFEDKAGLVELFVGDIAPKVQQAQQANK